MAIDAKTLAASKKYTDNSIAGGGAVKGKNAVVDSITDITGGHRVTFKWTLDNGTVQTQSMDVMDGVDGQDGADGAQGPAGQDGADGLTPVITIDEITGGHRVTITTGSDVETVDIMDGEKGDDGDPGPAGQDGVGVPAGGTPGQVLKKKSNTDYDTEWSDGGGTGSSTLAGLDDTDITNPEEGQILVMNDSGDWENQDMPTIPTNTSELTNDSNFVSDASYVHTDNNYSTTAKNKLDGLSDIRQIGSGLNLNTSTGELTATGASITIDTAMSDTSVNPVQNKVITAALETKADSSDIPTNTSDLTNDSNFVSDSNYVHTDNNYDATAKGIVDGVTALSDRVSDIEDVVPTDASASNKLATADDIPDVSNFITNTVNNLTNYYLKSDTYTQTEVDNLIAAIVTLDIKVVNTLPVSDISRTTIYLVPKSTAQTQNIYDEYINTDGTASGWEKIGDTEIDLSDYVTDAELSTALADYTTTANLTTLLAAKQDTISDLATIRSGASAGATAYQKPSGGVPKTDLASAVQTSLDLADSAYQKPSTGVPKTDLASAVQTSLDLADSAYQKPSTGVPKTDLASAVQTSLDKADNAGYWVTDQDKTINTSVTQVQFTVPNAGYGYDPYFESADGTPVYVQGESKSGTTLTYTIRALTAAQLPCKAKLLAIPVASA